MTKEGFFPFTPETVAVRTFMASDGLTSARVEDRGASIRVLTETASEEML